MFASYITFYITYKFFMKTFLKVLSADNDFRNSLFIDELTENIKLNMTKITENIFFVISHCEIHSLNYFILEIFF